MRRHPENVLPLVGKSFQLGAEYICKPFISDELPIKTQRRELELSRHAIANAQGFESQKAECLAHIEYVEKLTVRQH